MKEVAREAHPGVIRLPLPHGHKKPLPHIPGYLPPQHQQQEEEERAGSFWCFWGGMREAGAEGGDEDEELRQKMSRNRGKIPKLSMPSAILINAQITPPLYDGSRKP
jgi:hypothetical protein